MASDRSKRMVTMALNQQLRNKIQETKGIAVKNKMIRLDQEEYLPSDGSNSSDSECSSNEDNCDIEVATKNTFKNEVIQVKSTSQLKNEGLVTPSRKITILQDIVLQSPNPVAKPVAHLNTAEIIAKEVLEEIINTCVSLIDELKFTKKGNLRKRRKFISSISERKQLQQLAKRKKNLLKPPCKTCI